LLPIITTDIIQQHTVSETRATVISMKSFLVSASQALYLWGFGWMADLTTLFSAYSLTAIILLVLGGLAWWHLYLEDQKLMVRT